MSAWLGKVAGVQETGSLFLSLGYLEHSPKIAECVSSLTLFLNRRKERERGHVDSSAASPGGLCWMPHEAVLQPQHRASDCGARGDGSAQQHPGSLFLCLRWVSVLYWVQGFFLDDHCWSYTRTEML